MNMTLEERKAYVAQLAADFLAAKNTNCLSVDVWLDLASRYERIGANMNWYFCINRAAQIHRAARAIAEMSVAVETMVMVEVMA